MNSLHNAGFHDRVFGEIQSLAGQKMKVHVTSPPGIFLQAAVANHFKDKRYSVWAGGSVLASLRSFEDSWVTREEYDEIGPSVIHRKCF